MKERENLKGNTESVLRMLEDPGWCWYVPHEIAKGYEWKDAPNRSALAVGHYLCRKDAGSRFIELRHHEPAIAYPTKWRFAGPLAPYEVAAVELAEKIIEEYLGNGSSAAEGTTP